MNLVRAVFLVVSAISIACSAEAGIVHTAHFRGNTYHLLDTDGQKWWLDAEAEALSLGGHLVTIDDAAENQFVFDTFSSVAVDFAAANALPDQNNISLWIGLSDHISEGTFQWSSGSSSTYTNWSPGQPQGVRDDEDFVGLVAFSSFPELQAGKWHDVVGDSRRTDLTFGVVEVTAVPEPTSFVFLGFALVLCISGRYRRRGFA